MPLPLPLFLAALTLSFTPQASQTTASLRGVSAPAPGVAWASGTSGTYLRTTDGGLHWQAAKVPGAESLDFRDVEAFDAQSALLLAAGSGQAARIYKTSDAGAHWKLVLQNTDAAGFFDAFAFWDRLHGILLGDPVNGHFTVFTTSDGGETWKRATQPAAMDGEGAFAASGTCITVRGKSEAWFGTGGVNLARVFHTTDGGKSWTVTATPLASAAQSAGIFSLLFSDARHGIAVGGDYRKPADSTRSVAITDDGGKKWTAGTIPGGFRSAVLQISKPQKLLITAGTSGADYSSDQGRTWKTFSTGTFNALATSGIDTWAVGPKGVIAKLSMTVDQGGKTAGLGSETAGTGLKDMSAGMGGQLGAAKPLGHAPQFRKVSDSDGGGIVVRNCGARPGFRSLRPAIYEVSPPAVLSDLADQAAFIRWFTFLAEIQYFTPAKDRPREISDCSALLRYAYREALRNHNQAWSSEQHFPLLPALPSIKNPQRDPNVFLTPTGYRQFANAQTLQRLNSFFISRNIARAQPGDLLFYRRETAHITYHSMIYAGASQVNHDNEIYVVYHTGPEGTSNGEIRRLTLNQLLHFPDPQWQPITANPSFLGVYRWNILKAPS
jgi:uncharacterized protein YfaT (DUF1175 family)/photosystem II stability/assembly factor-like uncharacterized protein